MSVCFSLLPPIDPAPPPPPLVDPLARSAALFRSIDSAAASSEKFQVAVIQLIKATFPPRYIEILHDLDEPTYAG